MDLQLQGRTALVTGSTGGIGYHIARRLAQEGASVIICGRTAARLEEAAADIRASVPAGRPADVRAIQADPGTAAGCEALGRALPDLDILVNNIGIYESKPFGEISDADWMHLFETNVMSGVRLARSYFPGMLAKNWGRIIFIASEAAILPPPDMIHYSMTKTAQLTISRGLASLTKGTGVTVNSVLPGSTRSEGIYEFLKSVALDPSAPIAEIEKDYFARERPTSLIQRLIEPEEIASLVAYVASPLAAATNGAALRVDGGIVPTIF